MTTQAQQVFDYFNPENPSDTWIRNGQHNSLMPEWVQARFASGKNLTGCILEDKKPLRNYQQIDWTGETPTNDLTDSCPTCKGDMPFTFGVGRPSVYCSDACKMKAYRLRKKSKNNGVFCNDDDKEEEAQKTQSVGSVCNTHTKQWKPTVNYKNEHSFKAA